MAYSFLQNAYVYKCKNLKTLMGFPYFLATRREYRELGQSQLDYEGEWTKTRSVKCKQMLKTVKQLSETSGHLSQYTCMLDLSVNFNWVSNFQVIKAFTIIFMSKKNVKISNFFTNPCFKTCANEWKRAVFHHKLKHEE